MRKTHPNSSPGPDKLPYTLWRVGNDCWAPLLAHLFTAIGSTGISPPSFNLGTITPIPKDGAPDMSSPAAYRPITLLPTLYRLLAKVLAYRYGSVMQHAIGPEQSAYLPGRLIGDNINFTSLLPQVLVVHRITGANILVDISKAYDSADRDFIFQSMTNMGASSGMVNWARILLHDTVATVHANGMESAAHLWHAGVRQGCPLSPLLYLFLAQSLASWLQAQPLLGITIAGVRYVSTHYADDTQIHLADFSPAALASLTSALNTFGDASGQRINPTKSHALLIGTPPAGPIPTTLADIPVVQHITSLGISQSNPLTPPATRSSTTSMQTRGSLRPPPPLHPQPTPEHWQPGMLGS
jgi:hypothetical protein